MRHSARWILTAVAASLVLAVAIQDTQAQSKAKAAYPAVAGAGAAGAGAASERVVRIREFVGFGPRGLARTPEYTSSAPSGKNPSRDWAQLVVLFDSEPEWMDEVTFQYYALLHLRTSDDYTLMRGAVTHLDVARGRGHMSSAYLRPSTLARYGEVAAVAVEILYKGEVVAVASDGKMPKGQLPAEWWKNPRLAPKEGYILNKAQTPFALVNFDDFEAIK